MHPSLPARVHFLSCFFNVCGRIFVFFFVGYKSAIYPHRHKYQNPNTVHVAPEDVTPEGMALGCEFAGGSDLLMHTMREGPNRYGSPMGSGTRIIRRVSLSGRLYGPRRVGWVFPLSTHNQQEDTRRYSRRTEQGSSRTSHRVPKCMHEYRVHVKPSSQALALDPGLVSGCKQ